MTISDIDAAAANLQELVDAALSGEEVVITRDGTPVARLVPEPATSDAQSRPRRVPGRLAGQVVINDPDWDKPDPELEALFYSTDKFLPGQ
jgi:antitoxin (DNA-binding transcriptional repressor) of toxin-antitoxin stability system